MKIIVFDDDPTGSQTVFGCPLLLKWDQEILSNAFKNPSSLLFLLTNSRALSTEKVEVRIREICKLLKKVIKENGFSDQELFFISRGDSTLRGHGVLEPKIINEELGPFDATFHVPAFFEGGRQTVDNIHLLNNIPVHETIFAKDKIFSYPTSDLAKWLEYKSNGDIDYRDVSSISIQQLDDASNNKESMVDLMNYISEFSNNKAVIVNASTSAHLDTFANSIKLLNGKKRFLFRSAASLLNSLSDVSAKANSIKDFSILRLKNSSGKPKPGLVIVGSYVKLADDQLKSLLHENSCVGVELDVNTILKNLKDNKSMALLDKMESQWLKELNTIIASNLTPVLYTSRREVLFKSTSEKIQFGISLARIMAKLVREISNKLGYIISKGGITTHILLSDGFQFKSLDLKGQILPGLSVVCSSDITNNPLPILTFPGNLGDQNTLVEAWKIMDIASE